MASAEHDDRSILDLILAAEGGEFCHPIHGDEWGGWWTGTIADGRQVFVSFGGRAYSPPDERATMHIVVFDPAGNVVERIARPDPLVLTPWVREDGRNATGPEFDVAELEARLGEEFGSFQGGTIRVRPFGIHEIDLWHQALPLMFAEYRGGDEERERAIREWIAERCSVILYGEDYWLGGDGSVIST